ncbi:MAG: AAA family ATPase [Candidatus Aenigmarchaeota archaeon]|nr:AAA family ATPase [Candidatus Aenigmarchaeota archaeon]
MITRISLRGWKSHIDSELEFSKGVNAIIGIMGSGKTSIMDAVSFALYGTFPALQSKKITINDLIMRKPQKKTKAEIGLDFLVNGSTYSIKKVIEADKGTTLAEIRKDGKLLDVNPANVTRQVEAVLQMDYDLFSRAVYSEQNGLDYFLRVPKGQRMEQIDGMLKVDRFEDAREASVSLSNKISSTMKEKARLVSQLEKEMLADRILNLGNEIESIKEEAKPIKERIRILKNEQISLSQKLSGFEKLESESNKLNRELQGVKSAINELSSSLKNKREDIKGKDSADVTKQLGAMEEQIKTTEEEIRRKRDLLTEQKNHIASVDTRIDLIDSGIEELQKLAARCPVCDSPITDEKKQVLIKSRKSERKSLDISLHDFQDRIITLSNDIQSLEKRLRQVISEREKLVHLSSDLKLIHEWEKRLEENQIRRSETETKLAFLEEQLSETNVKDLRTELQEKTAEERGLEVRLNSIREKIMDREEMLRDLMQRNKLLEDYRSEVMHDGKAIDSLQAFVKALKATQDQLREEFLKTVNKIMAVVWNELYPYADFTGIQLIIDKDYVLQLKGSEGWISVDGIASGGERSMACLALRIAFSLSFIPNLRWLILDEPTHNLDSNAISQFVEVLREKMPSFTEQVFLITHDERISEGVQGVQGALYRLDRNKNEDGATQVKRWE